jgi:hypothetical protein
MGGGPPPPPPLSNSRRDTSPPPTTNNSKTLKLHWKEAVTEAQPVPVLRNRGIFWQKVKVPEIDTEKLCQLFETKTKDVAPKVTCYHKWNHVYVCVFIVYPYFYVYVCSL